MNKVKLVFIYVGISLLCTLTSVCLYFLFCTKVLKQQYPTLFGLSTAIVKTGSMSPTIKSDDVIFTVKQSNYYVGDVITFKDGENTTTHRIIAITENGYITKGDANDSHDPLPVVKKDVYGKVVGHSSFLGEVVKFVQSPLGLMSIVFFTGATISIVILINTIKQKTIKTPTDSSYTSL